jgi:hypothetical protein
MTMSPPPQSEDTGGKLTEAERDLYPAHELSACITSPNSSQVSPLKR